MKYLIIPGIFILGGLILFAYSLILFLQTKRIIQNGIKTLAIITNKEKKKSDSLSGADEFPIIYYEYEIMYVDYNGKTIKKVSDFSDQTNLVVGSKIEVIYDKEKTDNFLIFAKKQRILSWFMFIFSSFFIVMGILFLIFKR
ncbi:MAG: DUF3592 domain-containing protein [Prevotellaceae bacterium]|jgi:hypothetical protein|nr:DUF3592 domain-containing protein [Prevotellaceae bacterium]